MLKKRLFLKILAFFLLGFVSLMTFPNENLTVKAEQTCVKSQNSDALITSKEYGTNNGFGNENKLCIVDNRAVFDPSQVPTYDSLFDNYYSKAKFTPTDSTNKNNPINGPASQSQIPFSGKNQIYYINGDLNITGNNDGTYSGLVFVSGNLHFFSNYIYGVSTNGTIFIVKGNIIVEPIVVVVEGVLVNEGMIFTAGDGCLTNSIPVNAPLVIRGSLINLNRNPAAVKPIRFCRSLLDNTFSAERVFTQPKFLAAFREILGQDLILRAEDVALGSVSTPPAPPPVQNTVNDPIFNNLIAYWSMDESQGPVVNDYVQTIWGYAANPLISSGKYGNARNFNGDGDYIALSRVPNLYSNNTTITAWVYPTAYKAWASIYNRRNSSNVGGVTLEQGASGEVYCDMYVGSSWRAAATAANSLPLNKWTHIACTYDGNQIKVYLNGTLATTHDTGGGNINSPPTPAVEIGRNIVTNTTWQGKIDEVGLWFKALSAQEITSLINQSLSPDPNACTSGITPKAAPPTNLLPGGTTSAGIKNILWTPSSTANQFYLRVDDEENGWVTNCSTVNSGDVCQTLTSASYSYDFKSGHSYTIWVHQSSPNCAIGAATVQKVTVP